MDTTQKALFQSIKNLFKKETFSLVDEISEVLHLEKGASYKRISGNTSLKIDEVVALCLHYNISFDTLLEAHSGLNQISFVTEHVSVTNSTLREFLLSFGRTFDSLRKGRENELIFLGNELSLPYYFDFPKLLKFLHHMWHHEKGGYQHNQKKLENLDITKEDKQLAHYLSHEFNNHPTTEILGPGIMNAAFHRLKLGHRLGIVNQQQAEELHQEFGQLLEHLKKVAEVGCKFNLESGRPYGEAYLLINKYYFGGAQIYYNTDGYEKAFLSTEYPDFIHTNDPRYTTRVREKIYSQKAFSVNISRDNALERAQYFRNLTVEWEKLGKEIENQL